MRRITEAERPVYRDGTTRTERRGHIDRLLGNPETAGVVCPDCRGTEPVCVTCGGHGLVCPTCHGARLVLTASRNEEADRYYHRAPLPCPVCCPSGAHDTFAEAQAIKRVLQRVRELEQVPF